MFHRTVNTMVRGGHAATACLFTVLAASPVAAQTSAPESATDAELFERVFKHHDRADHAPVVLVLDGTSLGPIVIKLPPNASPVVPAGPVLTALAPKLRADVRRNLLAAVRAHQLSLDALHALGLSAVYDPRQLEVRIDVPPELTERTSHDLRGSGAPPEAAGALRPSDVSGYLNVRGGGADTWTTGDRSPERAPLHLNLDSAFSVDGWLLEGRADFVEAPIGAHRGDVLLSRDDPEQALRYLAGDFAVPATGLQPSYPVLGLGIVRNFSLQPYRVIQPIGQFDFLLDQPSRVTVLVNGAPIRTLSLPAGRHDVRDLPLSAGINDVELLITDDGGVERRLSFSTANTGELLAPGVVQYALGLGLPLIDDAFARTYDLTRPILSARRRWGVRPMLTIGGSFDGDFERQVTGGDLALATTLGTFALEIAASNDVEQSAGHAEGVRYDYNRTATGAQTSTFSVAGHHYAPDFRSLGLMAIGDLYSDDLSLSASRKLFAETFGVVNLRYQVGRDLPDAQDASIGLSRSFGGVGLDVVISGRHGGVAPTEARGLLSAHWTLPERKGSVYAATRVSNVNGTSTEAMYTTGSGPPPGGVVSTINVNENPENVGGGGTLTYTGNRLTSSVSSSATVDRASGDATQTTSFELGTALVFAGGEVAWSRPVTGSFVIVARNETVAGHEVEVNPTMDGYSARADSFGLAVLPNLEAYRVGHVNVYAPTLPVGYSLGPGSYAVLPTYKSGTLIRVGEEGTVFLRGTLHHAGGEPVALAMGEVVSIDDPGPPLVLMTNRAGRFGVMGVKPGHYEIRLSGGASTPIRVEIPAGLSGLYSAGVLEVE